MCLHTVCVEQPDQHHLKAHNAHGITHDCYMEVVWTRCPFVDVAGFWKLKRFCFSAQAPRPPRSRPKTAASGPSQYSPKCPRKALVFKVGAGNRLATSPGPNVNFAIANLPKTSHVKSTGLVTRGLQPAAPKGHKPARDGQFVAQIPGPPTQHQPQPWIQGVVPANQTRFRFDGTPAERRPFCFASPRERNPISTNSSGSLVMICSGPNSGAASALAGGMMECTFRP